MIPSNTGKHIANMHKRYFPVKYDDFDLHCASFCAALCLFQYNSFKQHKMNVSEKKSKQYCTECFIDVFNLIPIKNQIFRQWVFFLLVLHFETVSVFHTQPYTFITSRHFTPTHKRSSHIGLSHPHVNVHHISVFHIHP